MSRIEKLSILGIRSFDPARSETIKFETPLTLIVGTNGSGKTTIIECLRYATTGDLPPNSQGGNWIHDPNLCGEKEILAQVRLSFRSTEQVQMVVGRNLQLTVRKASRSVKGLETSLHASRKGEKIVMSSRKADINELIPRYLGVSKAVLNSVVFCHQDESLWPLAAPKDLKERFDLIFEAQKYSKAIDNIKVMRKGQQEKLKLYERDFEHEKVNKNRADKSQKQSEQLDEECGVLRKKSEELGVKIREATRNTEAAWAMVEEAGKIVGELTGKRIEEKSKEESVQSLRQNLVEMSETDAELTSMLNDYEHRVSDYEQELDDCKGKYRDLSEAAKTASNKVVAKERECGSYEAQQQNYERQLETRETLVKDTARTHNIRGFDLDLDDAAVNAFMDRISKMARDQNAAFERARRETAEELQHAQKAITTINEKKSALSSRKESARQAINTNDRKIGALQSQLDKISIDEGGKAAMEANLQDTEGRLQSTKTSFASADWPSQIDGIESEARKHDDSKEKLDSELVEGTRQAGDSARLDFVQKELKERQRGLETMTGAHGDKIVSVVGASWKPASLESDYQRAVEAESSKVSDAEKRTDGVGRELEQLDFKLNTLRSDLKSRRAELQYAVKEIRNKVDCDPEEYTQELMDLEREYNNLKEESDAAAKIRHYFELCLQDADKPKINACRTCQRGFKDDKAKDRMRDNVLRELKKLENTGANAADLEELEQRVKQARAAATQFELWEKLKEKDIPALEAEETKLNEKREKLNSQLEHQDQELSDCRAAKRDVDALSRTIQTISKYSSEIKSFEAQIQELGAKQKAAGLSRGMEQIQDDIKKVNEEARAVKARLTQATSERDRTQKLINNLELEVRDIRSKLSTADYQLKEKASLEAQINELKETNSGQRDNIRSVDQEIQGLGPQLSQAQEKYDDISSRGTQKDRELQAETSKLNNSLNQLKVASQDIQSYIERDGPAQLAKGKAQVAELQAEVSSIEKEQTRALQSAKKLEEALRNVDDTKRSISDNQRYRRDLRALQAVRESIKELEETNAEAEKYRHEREGHKQQLRRNELAGQQSTIIGELKSKDVQLKQLLDDWETEYKDAHKNYKLAQINVGTTKGAIEDLGRYAGALDKAVMKYHSLKMEEINRIVDELWKKTYRGTDVDTILIRSESENQTAKKNYNYRVCMVKSDAEMDMRGRCSAGQRVLASIIIRLALAECFGVNCGLIALDEPTTNLDRDNIRSLAESLSEIIKVRRQQRNFQLIVITHDEDFLRFMQCADYADTYYRVSRNERQKSEIQRQSIAEVM